MSMKKCLAICLVLLLVVSFFGSMGGSSDSTDEDRFTGFEQEETLTSELGIDSSDDPTMYVLVNSTVYEPLEDELTRYKEDVEDTEDMEVEIIENTYTDPSEIRNFLQDGYENDGLVGVFLVGNLPYAEFEISDHPGEADGYSRFPIDHYYTDLDGTWEDTNNSGVYDEHLNGDGDLDPEIWLGRISMKTDWADEIELYENYFEKVFQYRRGNLSVEDKSLLYIDDDWIPWTDDFKQGILRLYDYDNVTLINDPEDTKADDYSERVQEGYEWIQIHCHANESAKRHAFRYQDGPKGSGGNFTSEDLYEYGHNSLFQNVFTCGSADYTVPDYLCGWYALSEAHGLANVGSTQPGSMLEFENYYGPLSYGRTLGEAMQDWWIDTVEDDIESRSWHYGMTTIGDPTLSIVEEPENREDAVEIEDWHDLDAVRDDLSGDYVLMNDLDENTDGYDKYNTEPEDYEVDEEDARVETWGEGDTINIILDEDDYESISVEDEYGNPISHTVDHPTITIEEDTIERYVYVIYENAVVGWEPIGDWHNRFTGTFDGNEHEISDLYIDRPGTSHFGLFGPVDDGGEVRNVGVIDAYVSGFKNLGGLVGINDGIVEDSYASGNVSGGHWISGLVGRNDGIVKNSYATGDVSGDGRVGALVGRNDGIVKNSYATGNVSSNGSNIGGLVGRNWGTVENSYATGNISGAAGVGGLVGHNTNWATISNSYATGDVSGGLWGIGGLVGSNWHGTVENSHYNIDTVEINGGHHVTIGGIFEEQYQDWIENKNFDTTDYSDTLVSSGDYYEIDSTDGLRDLLGFAGDEEYKFRLTDDIDLSDEPGLYIPYLSAEFDGHNHTIYDLHIDKPFAAHVGMFGCVAPTGEVYNVGLVDVGLSGYIGVGGLVGYNFGTVSNSYATGDVNGDTAVGGLIGFSSGVVSNSFSMSKVSGESPVGGLVGDVGTDLLENSEGEVIKSYSTGKVLGDDDDGVGGLVGSLSLGEISNSFWNIETSGQNDSDGGTGKTTAEMLEKETFTDAGWDFEENWDIIENETYPFLKWQEEDTYPYRPVSFFEVDIVDYDEEVEEDEEVVVQYEIENTGELEDTQDIEFYVDDKLIQTEEDMSLEAYRAHEREFTWETEEGDTGDHELEVLSEDDSEVVTVTVIEEDEEEEHDWIPGFTFTLLLLSVIFALAFYSKKKRS